MFPPYIHSWGRTLVPGSSTGNRHPINAQVKALTWALGREWTAAGAARAGQEQLLPPQLELEQLLDEQLWLLEQL